MKELSINDTSELKDIQVSKDDRKLLNRWTSAVNKIKTANRFIKGAKE